MSWPRPRFAESKRRVQSFAKRVWGRTDEVPQPYYVHVILTPASLSVWQKSDPALVRFFLRRCSARPPTGPRPSPQSRPDWRRGAAAVLARRRIGRDPDWVSRSLRTIQAEPRRAAAAAVTWGDANVSTIPPLASNSTALSLPRHRCVNRWVMLVLQYVGWRDLVLRCAS